MVLSLTRKLSVVGRSTLTICAGGWSGATVLVAAKTSSGDGRLLTLNTSPKMGFPMLSVVIAKSVRRPLIVLAMALRQHGMS